MTAEKKTEPQKESRIHTHEKITSDKCHVVYHSVTSLPGMDGEFRETLIECSDTSSEKAYITMRKLMTDLRSDSEEFVEEEPEYNNRASRAVGVA